MSVAAWLRDVIVPAAMLRPDTAGDSLRGDLAIDGGRIVGFEPAAPGPAPRIVLPALVEAHCHLDKCYTIHRMDGIGGDLRAAILAQADDKANWSEDDLRLRVTRGLQEAVASGCNRVRSHVDWMDGTEPPTAWSVIGEVAADLGCAVDRAALIGIDMLAADDVADTIARHIARTGGTLGAFLLDHADRDTGIRAMIRAADRYGLALDFHVDEGLADGLDGLGLIAKAILETGFEGPVLCGHACSLMNVDGDALAALLAQVAESGLVVTALPTTNLYLQGRVNGTPDRRGLTRLRELQAAGVPIAVASDNVADAFCPTGHHDPMAALDLAVMGGHLDPPFGRWLPAITHHAARGLGADPVYVDGARLGDVRLSAATTLPDLLAGRGGPPRPILDSDMETA